MLKEALEHMISVGRTSADVIVKPSAEPDHVYFVRQPDGSLNKHHADSRPVARIAYALNPIVDLVSKYVGVPNAEVWYGNNEVVGLYGADLRNRVVLTLKQSDQYITLAHWAQNKPQLSQVDLIRSLRTTFRDSLTESGELVEILRRVNFKATATTQGEVGHGRASLGKEIAGEVTGTKAIPEYIRFGFPVFANPCFRRFRAVVECALEPDAATGTFRVIPLPGNLDAALDEVVTMIGVELREALSEQEFVGIYYGKP